MIDGNDVLQMRQELEKIRRRLEAELAEAREQLAEKTSQLDELEAMMNRREEELQQALNKYFSVILISQLLNLADEDLFSSLICVAHSTICYLLLAVQISLTSANVVVHLVNLIITRKQKHTKKSFVLCSLYNFI